jgi:hypothetical protein
MNIIKIRSFNAYRAKKFGYEYTASDKIIMMRSLLHTHTELQFSERHNEVSFSSTLQDDVKGCRFKQIEYSHPERWDTLSLFVTDEEEDLMYQAAQSIEGKPYDLLGLLSFSTEFEIIKPDKDKYWCTEAALFVVKSVPRFQDIPLSPEKAHPTLADAILRYYIEQIPSQTICPLCGQYLVA